MNKKYPIEAFALAMVLFSSGVKMAMIVGIGIIFGDVLQALLSEMDFKEYKSAISAVGSLVTCAALYIMAVAVGMTPEWKELAGFAMIAVLTNQDFRKNSSEDVDYSAILRVDSLVYLIYFCMAFIRELLASGAVFEFKLLEASFISASFGKPMFALIFTAITIAIINRVTKYENEANAALWICIPTIIIEVPFVWNNVPEIFGTIVGIVVTGIIYVTFRQKLLFSNTGKYMGGIPVELATLGMIYMIMTIL